MVEVRADTAQYTFKVAGQTFQVLGFEGHEEVSHLFRYVLTLWKDDPELAIAPLLRQPAETILKWGSFEKHFYGIVASFTQTNAGRQGLGGAEQEYGEYRVEVVPTLWILGQKTNCRIFQELSADQVIKKVLDERGLAGKYVAKMSARAPREYCVQYRETDLAFIQRLMEEEGIFYYFTHEGEEKLVLGDDPSHWATCTPEASVRYASPSGTLPTAEEFLEDLVYDETAFSGKVTLKDYDYRDPAQRLLVDFAGERHQDLPLYDYHVERYSSDGQGRFRAKIMAQAQASLGKTLTAAGTWRSASSGCKMTLTRAYRSDLNREWVLLSVSHTAYQQADTGVKYRVSLVAIPSDVFFRPRLHTPQPIANPQTAQVVGPPGERIYMDATGRAKVQFHWDLEGQHDENTSCWIRVAQPYAGMEESSQRKHGFQWHPLVGDEVVVDFLEGDPDNPIIVGSVYNGQNTPIVTPDQLIRNRILTPYQHQLLLDDAGASIRLNTGGNEHLTMVDKNREEGTVTIETRGMQHFKLEDNDDEAGNLAELITSGGHRLFLAERDRANGILARTIHGHRLAMSDYGDFVRLRTDNDNQVELHDPDRYVEIHTAGGHKARLDDAERKILITSTGGGRIEINDAAMFIEISSPTGEQKLSINYAGTGIGLSVSKGNVTVGAPTGSIEVKGKSITVSSDTDLNLTGKNIMILGETVDINGTAQVTVSGATVAIEGTGQLSAKGATTTLEGTGTVTIKGGTISSEAKGVHTVKGALVKLN